MHYKPAELPLITLKDSAVTFRSIRAGDGKMEISATWVHSAAIAPGDRACPCDHYGYVLEGAFRVRQEDGSETAVYTGDVYFIPAGHRHIYVEACHHIDINGHDQLHQLLNLEDVQPSQPAIHRPVMRFQPEEIPVLTPDIGNGGMRSVKAGDTDMEIGASWCRYPIDTTEFYKGLAGDTCPCDHYGYVTKGSFRVVYADGSNETVSEGDVYFIPKGHVFIYVEPCNLIEFNSHTELRKLMTHFNVGLAQAKAEGRLMIDDPAAD